jgi:Sulfotransferase family
MSERRCIIVAGFPRSGTSWLAKGLSFARGFTYYREPDNVDKIPEAEERFRYLYLTGEHDDPAYRRLMTRACAGRVVTASTMTESPGPLVRPFGRRGRRVAERFPILFLRKRHVLIKLVNANLNLAWFSANFPRARQVCVLRHPCGQFESWRRLGWEPDPHALLANSRLVEDHLGPFVDLIAGARSFWERAGALWAATVHVIHRQTRADGGRLIVAYEWLCGDPVPRFQELYRRLELTWSPGAETFLLASDTDADPRTYSTKRPTAIQIDKWKERLGPGDIEACRRFVEPFGLPYYPGFESQVGSFSGDLPE